MEKYWIEDINFNESNETNDREVVVTLNNGTEIHIVSCYESWEQYGGTKDELYTTVAVADLCNDWLHEIDDEPPCEVYDYIENKDDDLRDMVYEEIAKITDREYATIITDNILNAVRTDIEETADEDYNSSDVSLAVGRVLAKMTEK